MITMTESFILSEMQNSIGNSLIGFGIVCVVVILLVIWIVFGIKEIRKEKLKKVNESGKKSGINLLAVFGIIFLIFGCGAFLRVAFGVIEEISILQYALNNHTYEVKEYKIVNKYFETYFDSDGDTKYNFCIVLDDYEVNEISESEYDKVKKGDSIYMIFAIKGEERLDIGEIYLVGEYLYQGDE